MREAVTAARLWLEEHPTPAAWIVDPVIAVGDGNLDNVMWDGHVCRLIDREEYGVSDLAYEVAGLIEHASTRLERRVDTAVLLQLLMLSDVQRARVEHHRRLFASLWLAMLMPGKRAWRRNPRGSTEDQARHLLGLFEGSSSTGGA